jgi:hypothetical protein
MANRHSASGASTGVGIADLFGVGPPDAAFYTLANLSSHLLNVSTLKRLLPGLISIVRSWASPG